MNKKGQGVFFAVILGIGAIICFFVALPILMQFLSYGASQIDQPFTILIISIIPIFIFIMIVWWIIAIARNQ